MKENMNPTLWKNKNNAKEKHNNNAKKKKHELNNNYIKHRPSSSIKEEQGHNKTWRKIMDIAKYKRKRQTHNNLKIIIMWKKGRTLA